MPYIPTTQLHDRCAVSHLAFMYVYIPIVSIYTFVDSTLYTSPIGNRILPEPQNKQIYFRFASPAYNRVVYANMRYNTKYICGMFCGECCLFCSEDSYKQTRDRFSCHVTDILDCTYGIYRKTRNTGEKKNDAEKFLSLLLPTNTKYTNSHTPH